MTEARALESKEAPDAFGAKYTGECAVVEAKTSRKDFLADLKKPFRECPSHGIGQFRWYAAPSGLIKPWDLPRNWGLLEPHGSGMKEVVAPRRFNTSNSTAAMAILVSVCRFRADEASGSKGEHLGKRRKRRA